MAFRSDLLLRQLRERHDLADLAVDQSTPEPFVCADPYLLASTLQKAVRRGDLAVARRAGHQLNALDRQRLWRRLAVIALEDIGVADIATMAELVTISTLPAARRFLGGDIPALDIALVHACAAVKDRSGDHLGSITARERIDAADKVALSTASQNALLAMLASSGLPWNRRLRAALLVSGRADNPDQSVVPNPAAVFGIMKELGAPSLLIAACEAYAARQRDALPVFVPFAWMLDSPGWNRHALVHDLPDAEMIGDWPAYAFDPLHTRLGKRAVSLWLRSYLTIPPFGERQVAAALWNAESAVCDRTLSWSMSGELRQRAYAADLSFRGVPAERHAELMAWVKRERPALIAARHAVWNSVVRQSGKPAERLEQANLPLPVPQKPPRRD